MFALNNENSIENSTKPIENMQAVHISDNNRQANALEREKTSMYNAPLETTKIMSENEKLDDHMRNGIDYINLPAQFGPTDRAPTWIPQQEASNNTQTKPQELRFLHHLRPATTGGQILRDRYASHQQMDAENRLQNLEVIRPKENINLLNVKFRSLQHPRHARPTLPQYRDDYVNTFYDQTGTYIQERSGLYHTENYEPSSLVQAIPELGNQEGNHSTLENNNNSGDLLDKNKPKLFQYRAIGDYQNMRNQLLNKFRSPNDIGTIDSRIQEGNKQFVQRQSIYGQAYNTPKFLQTNTLSYHARNDPSRLMSTRYNNNLERVRSLNSYPMKPTENQSVNNKQAKTDDILVSPILHPSQNDQLYRTKSIVEHTDGYSRRSTARVYDSPFKHEYETNMNQQEQQTAQSQSNSFDPSLSIPPQLPRSVKTSICLPGPEIVARFIEPKLEPHTTYRRSYKDISYHEIRPQTQILNQRVGISSSDNRLKQWKLMDLQDRWSKTQAQQQYHIEHPEVVPDVGGDTIRAKKEILIADTIAKQAMMTVR